MSISWAGASMCPSCKRTVRHKPFGGPLRRHGCRLRWIARRVARSRIDGWNEGYRFALDNVSDPMVYADLTEFGTGWGVRSPGVGSRSPALPSSPRAWSGGSRECVLL